MGNAYKKLSAHLADYVNLNESMAILSWDQQTQMPRGGAESRARQLSTLQRMSHELFTRPEMGALIEDARAEVNGDAQKATLLNVVQYDYDQATKMPTEYVENFTREITLAHEVWAEARAEDNFAKFQPTLEKLMDLIRQQPDFLGYDESPYDAVLGRFERGMKTSQVKAIFDAHRPALTDLVNRISEVQQVDDSMLHQNYPIEAQRDFALKVVKSFGFDMNRGVQAISVHPFCTSFSVNDVRITTRFDENFLNPALFGMMHEAGHAMYEQGVSQKLEGSILAGGTSLGVHESQSRMWENIVGRSRQFWSWGLPRLAQTFPNQLKGVDLEAFYKAINKVERSFIRVEADEATYNLHIILRFELEQALLTGDLAVKDLPEAWNSKFQEFFGIVPPSNKLGVLQDVHWSSGLFGYFPTYALGNLLSVQYFNEALKAHPNLWDEFANGEFNTLRTWLQTNIHEHGRMYTGEELTQRITGESINPAPYVAYLEQKFTDVYGL